METNHSLNKSNQTQEAVNKAANLERPCPEEFIY